MLTVSIFKYVHLHLQKYLIFNICNIEFTTVNLFPRTSQIITHFVIETIDWKNIVLSVF